MKYILIDGNYVTPEEVNNIPFSQDSYVFYLGVDKFVLTNPNVIAKTFTDIKGSATYFPMYIVGIKNKIDEIQRNGDYVIVVSKSDGSLDSSLKSFGIQITILDSLEGLFMEPRKQSPSVDLLEDVHQPVMEVCTLQNSTPVNTEPNTVGSLLKEYSANNNYDTKVNNPRGMSSINLGEPMPFNSPVPQKSKFEMEGLGEYQQGQTQFLEENEEWNK